MSLLHKRDHAVYSLTGRLKLTAEEELHPRQTHIDRWPNPNATSGEKTLLLMFYYFRSCTWLTIRYKVFKEKLTTSTYFDAFFYTDSIDFFFRIFFRVPEIIKKKLKKNTKKMVLQKTLYILNIIYFIVNCKSFSSFLMREKFQKSL